MAMPSTGKSTASVAPAPPHAAPTPLRPSGQEGCPAGRETTATRGQPSGIPRKIIKGADSRYQHAMDPSVLNPQVVKPLRRREINVSSGSIGGRVPSCPQHTAVPSDFNAQEWASPALTEANSPSGVVPGSPRLIPQQATDPSVLSPQLRPIPTLTDIYSPWGGVDCPASFQPQHTRELSWLNAQV